MCANSNDATSRLAELKSRIPNVKCKGFCWRVCTGINMTELEHKLIKERYGIHIPMALPELVIRFGDRTLCPALDEQHHCVIHEDAEAYPTVCKAVGAVEHMPCPYGCEVEGGQLMPIEEYKLLDADINDVGGNAFQSPMDRRRLRQQLSTKTGVRRFRERAMEMMEGPRRWWAAYIKKWPEGEP